MTKIEWTEHTWNPIVGCSIVSPGCTNCYAMKMAARLEAMAGDGLDDNGYGVRGTGPLDHYRGTTKRSKAGPVWTGKIALAPDHILTEPLRRRKPTMWFVNSMSDLFHESVPDEWIDRVFAVMALAPQHTFQVLTKRAARMRDYIGTRTGDWQVVLPDAAPVGWSLKYRNSVLVDWPLPNVWLGVSCERQQEADARIPDLLATPAAVRFVSAEPLLAPINFQWLNGPHDPHGSRGRFTAALNGFTEDLANGAVERHAKLDWVIVGGESGPGARPMALGWAKDIVRQCTAAGVPVFVKQLGAYPTNREGERCPHIRHRKGADMAEWRAELRVREYPETATVKAEPEHV